MKKLTKDWIKAGIFLLVVLLIIWWVISPSEINYNSQENIKDTYLDDAENEIEDDFSNIEEMHWIHMPIIYELYVESDNNYYKQERIKWALELIEKETEGLVSFKEVENEEPIDLYIYAFKGSYYDFGDFPVLGEGGIINSSENRINDSGVVFYPRYVDYSWSEGNCADYPVIEVHEILHAFGFGHVYDSNKKIMYPLNLNFQQCKLKQIDNETISCLKKIYSNGEISGDCSRLNIFPYNISEEETNKLENTSIEDFSWEKLPISYSIFNCEDGEIERINYAIKDLGKKTNKTFFVFLENTNSEINFFCKKENDEEVFNFETDYWYGFQTYPAINKHYLFENGKIVQANISLFGYEKCISSRIQNSYLEFLAALRAIGLRNNYGSSTNPPKKIDEYGKTGCSQLIGLSSITRERINELYGF